MYRGFLSAMIAVIVVPASQTADSVPRSGPPVQVTEVAQGIYQFVTPDHGLSGVDGNSVAIMCDDGVFVLDTNVVPSSAAAVLTEIRRRTTKPVRWIVNSHWHYDHFQGNEVYRTAFPDASIITHVYSLRAMEGNFLHNQKARPDRLETLIKATRAEIDGRQRKTGEPISELHAAELQKKIAATEAFVREYRSVRFVPPNITFDKELTIYAGNRTIQLKHFVGNTPGDTAVYLPRERILLTGDLLVHPLPFGFNSHPRAWIASLKALEAMDVAIIVPGHGQVQRDKAYLQTIRRLLESLVAQVEAAARKGLTYKEALNVLDLESFRLELTRNDPELNRQFRERFVVPAADRAYLNATGEL
jgi:glyoxylase-like metal-dependent hydrolase (beta-lactamase superfamily II)